MVTGKLVVGGKQAVEVGAGKCSLCLGSMVQPLVYTMEAEHFSLVGG